MKPIQFARLGAIVLVIAAVAVLRGSAATLETIRSAAAAALPSSQLPQVLVRVDKLPRNGLGKVRAAA